MLKGGWGHDLSIAFGRDPKRDLAIVRTVREAVGEDAEIIVDVAAGSGWTASHAITTALVKTTGGRICVSPDP